MSKTCVLLRGDDVRGGQHVRNQRVRRAARLQQRSCRPVEPDADVYRQTVQRDPVAGVEAQVPALSVHDGVAEDGGQHQAVVGIARQMNGERSGPRPDLLRPDTVPPPVEAETQLVVAAEVVGVDVDHRLRPPRTEIEVGVVVDAVHVAVDVLVQTAAGRQEEAPVVLGRLGADHHVAPGPGGRAGEQARTAAPLVPGGLVRPRRPGVASQLDLRAVEVVEAETQAVGHLPLHLQGPVGQGGAVGGVDERPQTDVGLAQRAPGPQPVPHERAADLEAVVGVLLHPVAFHSLAADRLRQVRGQIAALEPFVGKVAPQAAVVLVGAALEHHVHRGARRLVPYVGPPGVDPHLLELVEVPVSRRRQRRHVGDHDAVERPGVLVACARPSPCRSTAGPIRPRRR